MSVSKVFSDLIRAGDPNSIAAACMLCPKSVLEQGSKLADDECVFKRIEILQDLSIFATHKYIIVPGKYCSCHFYQENVVKRRIIWTCKHDLGVRLRVALRGAESIDLDINGNETLLRFLV